MTNRFEDTHYIGSNCSNDIDTDVEDSIICSDCGCDVDVDVGNSNSCLDMELNETIINLAGGSDKHFTFTQNAPSDTWTINHGLNKFPSVSVVDSAGTQCQGEIQYIDANAVILYFGAAFSGKAYFN